MSTSEFMVIPRSACCHPHTPTDCKVNPRVPIESALRPDSLVCWSVSWPLPCGLALPVGPTAPAFVCPGRHNEPSSGPLHLMQKGPLLSLVHTAKSQQVHQPTHYLHILSHPEPPHPRACRPCAQSGRVACWPVAVSTFLDPVRTCMQAPTSCLPVSAPQHLFKKNRGPGTVA